MKLKVSICMDEKLLETIDIEVAKGLFRNRSHIIEYVMRTSMRKPENLPHPEVNNE